MTFPLQTYWGITRSRITIFSCLFIYNKICRIKIRKCNYFFFVNTIWMIFFPFCDPNLACKVRLFRMLSNWSIKRFQFSIKKKKIEYSGNSCFAYTVIVLISQFLVRPLWNFYNHPFRNSKSKVSLQCSVSLWVFSHRTL